MSELRKDTLSKDQYGPQDAGWDAYQEGIRLSDNPYPITNWKHYEWEQGWNQAAESCGQANPEHQRAALDEKIEIQQHQVERLQRELATAIEELEKLQTERRELTT